MYLFHALFRTANDKPSFQHLLKRYVDSVSFGQFLAVAQRSPVFIEPLYLGSDNINGLLFALSHKHLAPGSYVTRFA